MNRRDLVIVALATFCLTSTIFMILPSRSGLPYDPWADVSGPILGEPDGTINMRDISYEITHFNAQGDPTKSVIVTNLCNESQDYALINGAANVSNEIWYLPVVGLIYCGGFSKLSMMINVTNALNLTNPVTIYVDFVKWISAYSVSYNYVFEEVEPLTAINSTVYPSGVASAPMYFMTDVKGPYVAIFMGHTTSNNPQYSIMFNYTIYLRND